MMPTSSAAEYLRAFERAEEMASIEHARTEEIRRQLTFALVGAGTVGVEMASTLAEMSRMALTHDFRHIDPKSARILLYEAGPRILPTYPEHLSIKAQRHLESLGVEIYTNARVTRVDAEGIVVGQQRIEAATVLWGAGVLASPAGRWLEVETDKSGKIIVGPDLSVPAHPDSFCHRRHRTRHCSSSKSAGHQIKTFNDNAWSSAACHPGRRVRRESHSMSCDRSTETSTVLVLG